MQHRIFGIPEIVALSLPTDRESLAALARTCRPFKEPALDALWANLDSIIPLLLLLRPLKKTGIGRESRWAFTGGHLTSKDWDTYQKYCFRVRDLCFKTDRLSIQGSRAKDIDPSVFNAMAITRPSGLLLAPKLQIYTINSLVHCHVHSLLFINPQVQALVVDLYLADSESVGYILGEVVVRMPGLKQITIGSARIVGDIEDQIVDCLQGLKSLEKVTLPRHYLTSRTLEALSGIPDLKVISSSIPLEPAAPSPLKISQGRFQHLAELSIATSLDVLTGMISERDWAPRLRALEVIVCGLESMDDVHRFLEVLAQSRHQMTSVALDLFDPLSDAGVPSFNTILPLLSCHEVELFNFRCRHTFVLPDKELVQLLSSWPLLTKLSICPDFVKNDADPSRGASWNSLHLFAQHCPSIRHIGLHFKRVIPEPRMDACRLEQLECLHVGSSDVVDPFKLALFLAELCGRGLDIQLGDFPKVPFTDDDRLDAAVQSRWNKTKRLFPGLVGMRERAVARNMAKIQALEHQVKALSSNSSGASSM